MHAPHRWRTGWLYVVALVAATSACTRSDERVAHVASADTCDGLDYVEDIDVADYDDDADSCGGESSADGPGVFAHKAAASPLIKKKSGPRIFGGPPGGGGGRGVPVLVRTGYRPVLERPGQAYPYPAAFTQELAARVALQGTRDVTTMNSIAALGRNATLPDTLIVGSGPNGIALTGRGTVLVDRNQDESPLNLEIQTFQGPDDYAPLSVGLPADGPLAVNGFAPRSDFPALKSEFFAVLERNASTRLYGEIVLRNPDATYVVQYNDGRRVTVDPKGKGVILARGIRQYEDPVDWDKLSPAIRAIHVVPWTVYQNHGAGDAQFKIAYGGPAAFSTLGIIKDGCGLVTEKVHRFYQNIGPTSPAIQDMLDAIAANKNDLVDGMTSDVVDNGDGTISVLKGTKLHDPNATPITCKCQTKFPIANTVIIAHRPLVPLPLPGWVTQAFPNATGVYVGAGLIQIYDGAKATDVALFAQDAYNSRRLLLTDANQITQLEQDMNTAAPSAATPPAGIGTAIALAPAARRRWAELMQQWNGGR